MDPAAHKFPASKPTGAKRSGVWRRHLRRALLAVVSLLILLFLAGEIVFQTDLPRNLMVNALQKQLGLRVSADSLSTGWLGHTTLRSVTLTLPLADKAFVSVPIIKIDHSWLPTILLGGSLSIHEISIENPRLDVLQEPRGSWNIQEVVQLLGRAGGSKNAADQSQNSIPTLPKLIVSDATLVVTDNEHRSATIEHLTVTETPNGPLLCEYHATIPDRLDVTGKVAPGGIWAHEVTVLVQNIQSWTSPWITSWPASAKLKAHWIGQITNSQLVGRLNLEQVAFGNISVAGPFEVTASGDSANLRPAGVLVSSTDAKSLDTRLTDGALILNADGVHAQQVAIEIAGGRASLDGKFTFADNSATVQAAWRDVALPSSALQSGNLDLQYTPTLGQPRFSATLQSHGSLGTGQLTAQLAVDGTGNTLKTISFVLTAQKFRIDEPKFGSIDLSGLVAQVGSYPKGLLLEDLRLGHSHPLAGQGGYSIADHISWLSLSGRALPIPGEPQNTLDADFNIWTSPERIHIQQLFLRSGSLSAYLNGDYVFNLPKPLKAHAYLVAIPQFACTSASPSPFRGSLLSNIDLNGTVAPIDLALTGSAIGQDIHLGSRPIGDLKIELLGTFRDNEISLGAHDIQLLGGAWAFNGHWPARNRLFRIDDLSVKHLSISKALASDNVDGTLDGKWTVDINQLSENGIDINGSATLSNLVVGNPRLNALSQYLTFDQIQIPHTRLTSGYVQLDPITLTRKIGTTAGRATASLITTLRDPRQLSIGLNVTNWPVQPTASKAACQLSGKASMAIDLRQQSADGHVDLNADTSWNSQPVAIIQASVDLNHRQFAASSIQIKSLNGSADGNGAFDIDHPYQSQLNLSWKDMDLARLDKLSPFLASASGKMKGTLQVQPATTPRPLEPLSINLHIVPDNVQFRGFKIGEFQAASFLGPNRFVLDDSPTRPTQIAIAGGLVHIWGRVSRYEGDVYQSLAQFTLENLDLDEILPAGAKTARTPGRLSGQITVVGRPEHPSLAFGQGSLSLEQSDLAGAGPIAFLYNLMRIGHNASKPTGAGRIDFVLQNESIFITAMRYYDKGVEIRLSGQIAQILNLPHSPIALTAVGSAKPLKSIGLPDFADIDSAVGALQNDALNVQITGYLDNPRQKKIPFADIGQDMQTLLFGDAQPSGYGE